MVAGAEGGGNWEQLPNEYGVSFWSAENVLELGRDGGCTTLNVLNLIGLLTLI